MSKEQDNKAIVSRWLAEFWGQTCSFDVVDELGAPDMLLKYSLHEPQCGWDAIKTFMRDFRAPYLELVMSWLRDVEV
jgi:hypothetical protein